jgi:hypothetical protein
MKDNHLNPAATASLNLGGRPFTANVIAANWQRICRYYGKLFVSSAELLSALHQLDIQYSLDGSKLKKANAIGDILGTKHFNLPSAGSGKRAFYLPAIPMKLEEREAFAQLPPTEMVAEIQRMTKAVLSDDAVPKKDEPNDLAA